MFFTTMVYVMSRVILDITANDVVWTNSLWKFFDVPVIKHARLQNINPTCKNKN